MAVGEDGLREVGDADDDGTAVPEGAMVGGFPTGVDEGAMVGRDGVRDCAGDMEGHRDDGGAERKVVGE